MGYLQRVFSFNAFQLGTESKNKVFLSEEASTSIPKTLRLPLLPLLSPLGNTSQQPGGEVKFMVPFPTSIIAPRSFSRDLPSVICPVPTHSITR